MIKWDKQLETGIEPYYLGCFDNHEKLGIVSVSPKSKNLYYYSIPHKELGQVALLSGSDMTLTDNVGGEYKLNMTYYYQKIQEAVVDFGKLSHESFIERYRNTFICIRKLHTKKQLTNALLEYKDILQKLDQFKYCVIAIGCDDGHYTFYFKNKEIALQIMDMCDTFEELLSLTTDVTQLEYIEIANLKEDIIVLDERN